MTIKIVFQASLSATEQKQIKAAWQTAAERTQFIPAHVADNQYFTTWFKTYTDRRKDGVVDKLNSIQSFFADATFGGIVNPGDIILTVGRLVRSTGTHGRVTGYGTLDMRMDLGAAFFDPNYKQRVKTLVHEVSHLAADTSDIDVSGYDGDNLTLREYVKRYIVPGGGSTSFAVCYEFYVHDVYNNCINPTTANQLAAQGLTLADLTSPVVPPPAAAQAQPVAPPLAVAQAQPAAAQAQPVAPPPAAAEIQPAQSLPATTLFGHQENDNSDTDTDDEEQQFDMRHG